MGRIPEGLGARLNLGFLWGGGPAGKAYLSGRGPPGRPARSVDHEG